MITTLLAIIAIVIPILAWLLLHFIKKATVAETQNEGLKKASSIKDKQSDIAARPSDSPSDVINWLRDDSSK